MNLPVSFSEKVRGPKEGGGYPVQISAGDLDKNFQFAALDAEEGYIESSAGHGGNTGRKLKLPPIPPSGDHVLTSEGGALKWGSGAGLPEGEEGDILYHGEEEWQTLNAGHALAFNEYFVVINGALKKAKFLSTETPYDP
jgi:hypothetical protein